MKARSRNQCFRGKKINITDSEYVSVASVIQHANDMLRITMALPHFSTLPHKSNNFQENVIENKMLFFFYFLHK